MRHSAAAAALTMPVSRQIGPYTARRFSGGDMLLAGRLDLVLASADPARIKAMSRADQTQELLTMGALLCYPPAEICRGLYESPAVVREQFIGPVLFSLSPDQTGQLVDWVASFFTQASQVAVAIEPKPTDEPPKDTPSGN
jgi:hypothetical protein